ncbi:bacteriohemerythrin [Geothrix fuzhouensis]|uniref:bacteriohemerythrin n=1 Tax=Geothrix fuzhouensis TaxID=2966451 RepID=UPI0021487334|nr:bacteriohemerythrin [Geothrix fuzhouensis]
MLWYSWCVNPAAVTRSARSFVRWRRQFETGLEPIDQQHRELFETLGQLAGAIETGAPRDQLDEGLASLAQHLIKHCQTEETLMKEAGFSGRIVHANQHQDLVLGVRDLQYRRAKGQKLGLEAVELVREGLDHHICESDLAMAGYLKTLRAV